MRQYVCSALTGCLLLAAMMAIGEPVLPPAKGEQCVEPVEEMRRNHMNMLDHQRDRTVYQGIRGQRHSLTGCIDCHVQRDQTGRFIPVNAAQQFCSACHEYASVRIDCFECHATTPDEPVALLQRLLPVNDSDGEITAMSFQRAASPLSGTSDEAVLNLQ